MALATVPPYGLGNTEPIFIFILPLKHCKTFLNVNIFKKVYDKKKRRNLFFWSENKKLQGRKEKG